MYTITHKPSTLVRPFILAVGTRHSKTSKKKCKKLVSCTGTRQAIHVSGIPRTFSPFLPLWAMCFESASRTHYKHIRTLPWSVNRIQVECVSIWEHSNDCFCLSYTRPEKIHIYTIYVCVRVFFVRMVFVSFHMYSFTFFQLLSIGHISLLRA